MGCGIVESLSIGLWLLEDIVSILEPKFNTGKSLFKFLFN